MSWNHGNIAYKIPSFVYYPTLLIPNEINHVPTMDEKKIKEMKSTEILISQVTLKSFG